MARSTRRQAAVESEEETESRSDVEMRTSKQSNRSNRRQRREEEQEEEEEEQVEEEEEEEEDGADYPADKALEHLFIQTVLARRTLTQKMGQSILDSCASICGVDNEDKPSFESMRAKVDKVLGRVEMSFSGRPDEVTGVMTYTITNMVSDETSKLATEYRPEELALFRVIVERIMFARNMAYAIQTKDAIGAFKDNRVKLSATLTSTAKYELVRSFVARGWLDVEEDTNVLYLSQRSLRELARYLRETYQDQDREDDQAAVNHETPYVECLQCKHFVSTGWACPNRDCSVRMHKHCTATRMQATKQCPGCKTAWHVAEDGRAKYGVPVGVLNGAKMSGSRQSRQDSVPNKDSDDEEDDELSSQ